MILCHVFSDVCLISVSMEEGALRTGTVSAAHVTVPDTPEPPVTRVCTLSFEILHYVSCSVLLRYRAVGFLRNNSQST